ncbi:ATP-binding protein [Streptomyces sp. NPDC020883]|uniref:ATP-binding protein n=1 Tax=Streptomyces sp. NPDC020883 TaxID=3365099 RepID=UPI00379BB31B
MNALPPAGPSDVTGSRSLTSASWPTPGASGAAKAAQHTIRVIRADRYGRLYASEESAEALRTPPKYVRGALLLHAAYESTPAHVGIARNDVVRTLRRHGLTERLDDVRLLVSELVTNAVRHSSGARVTVAARSAPGTLFITVCDDSTAVPLRHRSTPRDEHGRGLVLLDLLAEDWGVALTGHNTKVVWCCFNFTTPVHMSPTVEATAS